MRPLGIPAGLAALAMLCRLFAPAAQADPGADPWKFVLPQAKWILGVDWARARGSAAAQVLTRPFRGAEGRLEASGLGLSAVASLERIIASGASLAITDEDGPQNLLVAIEGIIDRAKLKASMPPGTAVERFRGTDLFVPPGAKPGQPLVALAGSRWMLIGDRPSLAAVLGGKGGPSNARLFGRAARLALDGEIWLAISDAALRGTEIPAGSLLEGLRDVDLLVSLRRGLQVQASLAGDSPELAGSLAGILQSASSSAQGEVSAWLSRLQVGVTGSRVDVTLDLPVADLDQALEQARASALAIGQLAFRSILSGGSVSTAAELRTDTARAASPDAQPATPPTPQLRTIRIVGLDEGPKEIPYARPHNRER